MNGVPAIAYALVFLLVSAYLAGQAARLGGWGWLLLWPAVSFFLVAGAYAGLGPRVFGKRPDGSLGPASAAVLLPFFLFAWGVWHLQRLLSRGPAWHEVAPGVYIGRRLLPREVPAGVRLVVDLTAEFRESAGVRAGRDYRSLPTLDGFAPDERRLRALAAELAAHPGPVLVHCANGSGRSGTVVAAVLAAKGLAADAGAAVAMVRAARTGVRLKPAQRRVLERLLTTEK